MQRNIFKVNGFLLTTSFVLVEFSSFLSCITCSYAKHSDLYLWQVPFCNISCLALLTLELAWFVAISRRAVIFMKQLICLFKAKATYVTKLEVLVKIIIVSRLTVQCLPTVWNALMKLQNVRDVKYMVLSMHGYRRGLETH